MNSLLLCIILKVGNILNLKDKVTVKSRFSQKKKISHKIIQKLSQQKRFPSTKRPQKKNSLQPKDPSLEIIPFHKKLPTTNNPLKKPFFITKHFDLFLIQNISIKRPFLLQNISIKRPFFITKHFYKKNVLITKHFSKKAVSYLPT